MKKCYGEVCAHQMQQYTHPKNMTCGNSKNFRCHSVGNKNTLANHEA